MHTRNLARAVAQLVESHPQDLYPGQQLVDWLQQAKDTELARINVFTIADSHGFLRSKLLATFVRLVHEGVMNLNWDFHCTQCNAVSGSHRHLSDATAVDHCLLCNVDFRNTLDRNVEVTFTPAENLYRVSDKFQKEQFAKTVELHAKKQIRLPEVFVSGLDCLHVPLFREIFESETLSLRESLQIKQVCIMFTDIKGSTELYDRFGDSVAYGLIRDHFDILFGSIERNDGVVVKTIGDAVMASFRSPRNGVAAALSIHDAFEIFNRRKGIRNEIRVKIGLHAGSTIMVNLNNRVDYFGQTVNMAARVQGVAQNDEVIISDAIRQDEESVQVLRAQMESVTKRVVTLKGISTPQTVYRLNFARNRLTQNATEENDNHVSAEGDTTVLTQRV